MTSTRADRIATRRHAPAFTTVETSSTIEPLISILTGLTGLFLLVIYLFLRFDQNTTNQIS